MKKKNKTLANYKKFLLSGALAVTSVLASPVAFAQTTQVPQVSPYTPYHS